MSEEKTTVTKLVKSRVTFEIYNVIEVPIGSTKTPDNEFYDALNSDQHIEIASIFKGTNYVSEEVLPIDVIMEMADTKRAEGNLDWTGGHLIHSEHKLLLKRLG